MRLFDKVKTISEGIKLKSSKPTTETKHDAEYHKIHNEDDGQEHGSFEIHDGKLLSSSASADAQETGLYEKAAKKAGVKKDEIVMTSPSMVAAQAGLNTQNEDSHTEEDIKVESLKKAAQINLAPSAWHDPDQHDSDRQIEALLEEKLKRTFSGHNALHKAGEDPSEPVRRMKVEHSAQKKLSEYTPPVQKPKKQKPLPKSGAKYKILTAMESNAKTAKNESVTNDQGQGHFSAILHLAPATLAGVGNVCEAATDGCKDSCLNTSGRGGMFKAGEDSNSIQNARIRKTRQLAADPGKFMDDLISDIAKVRSYANDEGKKPVVRLNGTSDIAWEDLKLPHFGGKNIFEAHPDIQFYDYTKRPDRVMKNKHENYHLTFSRSDRNENVAKRVLEAGHNVAVVFGGKELPKIWHGRPVVSGVDHDLRFLDPKGGYVVGLKAKGDANMDNTGFVVWNHEGNKEGAGPQEGKKLKRQQVESAQQKLMNAVLENKVNKSDLKKSDKATDAKAAEIKAKYKAANKPATSVSYDVGVQATPSNTKNFIAKMKEVKEKAKLGKDQGVGMNKSDEGVPIKPCPTCKYQLTTANAPIVGEQEVHGIPAFQGKKMMLHNCPKCGSTVAHVTPKDDIQKGDVIQMPKKPQPLTADRFAPEGRAKDLAKMKAMMEAAKKKKTEEEGLQKGDVVSINSKKDSKEKAEKEARTARIKNSLSEVNKLLASLHSKQTEPKLKVIKSEDNLQKGYKKDQNGNLIYEKDAPIKNAPATTISYGSKGVSKVEVNPTTKPAENWKQEWAAKQPHEISNIKAKLAEQRATGQKQPSLPPMPKQKTAIEQIKENQAKKSDNMALPPPAMPPKPDLMKDDQPHPANSPEDKAHDIVEENQSLKDALSALSGSDKMKSMFAHLRELKDKQSLRNPENEAIGQTPERSNKSSWMHKCSEIMKKTKWNPTLDF